MVILSKLEYYVIEKINKAECFSVLADETSDISGIEQFTLGVRYTCCECSDYVKAFLEFVPVPDLYDSTNYSFCDVMS